MSATQFLSQTVPVYVRLPLKALTFATCVVLFFFAAFAPAQQNPQYGSMTACQAMSLGTPATAGTIGGNLNGFVPFPQSNAWNTNILNAAIDPNSAAIMATFNSTTQLHPGFGQANSAYGEPDNGIPYIVVDSSITPMVPITNYTTNGAGEDDVVVAPLPFNTPIEGGPYNCDLWPQSPSGDSHVLVLDRNTCWLYETWSTTECNGQYESQSETIFDMTTNEERPWGWTSADAAGLSVFAGLVRYDEAASGVINHAFRFTVVNTPSDANGGYFVLPAVHAAGNSTAANLMSEGTRVRLRSSIDISGYSTIAQPILTALMNYGMIMADNGSNFTLIGTPDARWNDTDLSSFHNGDNSTLQILASNFDVVDAPPGTSTMTPAYPGMDSVSAYTDFPGTKPSISSFTANGSTGTVTVSSGTEVTFDYSATGDSYDYIDNIGPVRLSGGSGSVTITPTQTMEYTLYSTNSWGQAYSTITVVVTGSTIPSPVFSPPAGVYAASTKVALTNPFNAFNNWCTSSCGSLSGYTQTSIYYTTNGSTPTTSSTLYPGTTLTVAATQTLEAIAVSTMSGTKYTSAVSSAAYTIGNAAAAPVFSPAAGSYSFPQTITISDTDSAASIYYTLTYTSLETTGSTPKAPGILGETPTNPITGTTQSCANPCDVTINQISVLEAIAAGGGYSNSTVTTGAYTSSATVAGKPKTNMSTQTLYTAPVTVTITATGGTLGETLYYTTDGTSPIVPASGTTMTCASSSSSTTPSCPLTLNVSTELNIIGGSGQITYANSAILQDYYTVEPTTAATPVFSPAAGTYTSIQTVTISDSTPSSTIYYTTNSTTPSTGSTKYTGAITVSTSQTLQAIAVASSYGNSITAQAAYTINLPVAATPTFSPVAGTYSTTQTVTISDSTPSSTIHYTTDGSTPTTGSSTYSSAITVSSNETLQAIATAAGYTTSNIGIAAYNIQIPAATPGFSPGAGTYTSIQTVTISDSTPSSTIYYTTNGSSPTTSSTPYSSAITVSSSETLSAIATASGYTNSAVASAAYTINTAAATPAFSPVAGTYTGTQSVTISDSSGGATIYYTTNGTTPTTNSPTYSSAITVSASETLEAIASGGSYSSSTVASAAYNIVVTTPTFSPVAGSYSSAQSVTISDTTPSSTIYYTTNGTAPTTNSTPYSTAIAVSADETLEAIATASGLTNSAVGSAVYTIAATTPTFSPVAGTYTGAQTITISDTTPSSTIYYTTNGTTPTTNSPTYSSAITVSASETLEAIASGGSYSSSAVASAAYTIVATTPTFSPVAGSYSSAQSVSISDTTPSSTIYYTTNGTTPTTNSTPYSTAIAVSADETLEAIATASGLTNSAVGSAVYTIAAATPTFSPVAGTYTGAQTITISDTTPSSTIYYTTNGSTPTTNSPTYSSAITVSASETVEAIAVAGGYNNSAVGSAAYTIIAATPTFSPTAGTYTTIQTVTISTTTPSATIYYTTDGTTPTTSSSPYSAALTVSANETLSAIATATGLTNSTVGSAAYTINLAAAATPGFSPVAGSYSSAQSVTISDATGGATIYYTTNGTTPTTSSPTYSSAIAVAANETIEAIATANGFTTSGTGSAAYTIAAATPGFSSAAGTYTTIQTVTISDATGGATIYYTTNGTTPTTSSSQYSGGITVSTNETLEAIATASGYGTSATGSAAYTINLGAAATPTFSPVAGTYSSTQSITISDSTPSSTIYYTTNGSAPTTTSPIYSAAISVSANETIEAIATANGFTASGTGSAIYTFATPAALTLPTPNTSTPLTGTSVTFSWTPGNTATHFEFWVGTSTGSTNLYNSGSITATSATVSDLPSNGQTLYARLYWLINGSWSEADYTYVASGSPTQAVLTTPAPNTSTPLTGTSVAFSWTPGNLATHFMFYVGTTGAGSSNLYNSGNVTATTETVSNLPSNGETLNMRLYSLINGAWQYTDYTYVANGAPVAAALTTPTPNTSTPLTGTSVAFSWTPGNVATHFEFYVGTTGVGSSNLYNSGSVTATTETVGELPNNGSTIYVRLYSLINGAWQEKDYTYVSTGTPTQATLTTPTPNTSTPLTGTSVAFSWTPGNTATHFELYVGTSMGSSNLYNSGNVTATSETVSDLPSNGGTVYVRLYSLINGAWQYTNYTYVAASAPIAAALITPPPTSQFTNSTVTFDWTPGNTATHFQLYLGASTGTSNLYNSGNVTVTTETVHGLPNNGEKIYARLYSLINGAWQYTDYTYTAF